MWRGRTLLMVLVLTALPLAATAQDAVDANRPTSVVTFYGHVFDMGLNRPNAANTEKPLGEENFGLGLGGHCTSLMPVADPAGQVAGDCRSAEFNQMVLFSTAGFVDIRNRAEFLQNGEYALLHNERGQTKDVIFDQGQSVTATVYFTMDAHGWAVGAANPYGTNCVPPHPPDVPCVYPYWGWDPGAFPEVVMDATLYMAPLGSHGGNASDAPPIQDVIRSGEATVVAKGQWGPDMVLNGLPGQPNVMEAVIDLGPPQVDSIPRENDFFLIYTVYQESPAGNYQVRSGVRWWSGELFPPSFTLPVKNAFDVERVIPNFAHGKLAILGVMNTPWGSYDVDGDSVTLEIEDPTGAVLDPSHLLQFGDFSVAHGGHYLPINVTWIWDYRADNARPGDYTVTVTAKNFQHSAEGTCQATFTIERDNRDRLVPGEVSEGVCGIQSASDEFLETITQGAG